MKFLRCTFVLLVVALAGQTLTNAQDPLPSWNDGAAKQAIVDFVRTTTESGGVKFVPPESVLPPLTRTAHYGLSIRSTRR